VLAAEVALEWPAISQMTSASEVFEALRRLAATGASRWILWPFRAVVRLPLAGTLQEFLAALPATLGLLALNYVWVLRSDAAFEEASAAYAERRAADRSAPSAGRRNGRPLASPFVLSLSGPPETAILWKNLILLGRYASTRTLSRFVPVVIALAVGFSRSRDSAGVAALASSVSLLLAGLAVLIGPQIMRNDLRQDLASLAVVKSWPVRGAALVRGELLAPGAVLTVAAWLLIFTGAVCARPSSRGATDAAWFGLNRPASLALAAGFLAPALILAQLVLQNGLAILFPAWVAVGTSRARGIDAMGQRMLMMAGTILALVTALLPAAIAALRVGFVIYSVTQAIPIVIPALVLAVVLIAECWLAAELLGGVLDRTDVSALEPVD
jgi:ABC-2 type transport system permease protein